MNIRCLFGHKYQTIAWGINYIIESCVRCRKRKRNIFRLKEIKNDKILGTKIKY